MPPPRRRPVAVYGAGGFGREMAWALRSDGRERFEQRCFVDDGPRFRAGDGVDGLPVLPIGRFLESMIELPMLVAVAEPATRERLVSEAGAAGASFVGFVHEDVRLAPSVSVGTGAVICSGSRPTVDVRIEAHAHVNLGCTLGHDVVIGEFATLFPGVHVSGNVEVGASATLGTGAVIVPGRHGRPLRIGRGAVVGAGACVVSDLEPDTLYVGVPARAVRRLRP